MINMATHDPNVQTVLDMHEARQKCSFDISAVGNLLYGGELERELHSKSVEVLSKDPAFDKSLNLFMTRSQLYKRALSMTVRVGELKEKYGWSPRRAAVTLSALDESLPINLHSVAFEPVVMSQGSKDLIAKYGGLIAHRGILGCYLQTELGHGTNVSKLETTATYLPDHQEFEIHSPTLTSTKWWIGSLGKTATHGVVQARLILPGGNDVGPHLFFVQLRSLDDHRVLPGIRIGDIGPKAMGGTAAIDNGFARFDHVRIPRSQMLSKFAQVTPEGIYVKPPHSKVSYGGMLYIRSTMVTSAGRILAKAATVSIRYATVRRQGNKAPNGLERQAITYPSVYYRLLPILSRAFVYILLGRNLSKAFEEMASRLSSGDTSLLAELHATTSGLKVLVSTTSVQDIEVARRSMGGHGYSGFAELGRMYSDHLPSATYEGDNFVLDQQVVRAALKSLRTLRTTKTASSSALTPSSAYLRLLLPSASPPPALSASAWNYPSTSILLLEWRAARMVGAMAESVDPPDASADQRISRAVSEAFVAAQVGEMLNNLTLKGNEARIIAALFRLYLLVTVESALVDIMSFGLLSVDLAKENIYNDCTKDLRVAIDKLCQTLLPEAIGLTDAFGYADWELNSALGVYDGRVYEALWNYAQTEPLNQTEVPDGYKEYIKPMLERGQKLARQWQEARSKL